jgi:hypothetical protein
MTSRSKIYVKNQSEVCGFFANYRRNNHSGYASRLNTAIRYVDFPIFMKGGVDKRGTEEVIRAVYGVSVIILLEYLVVVFRRV